MAQNNNFGFMPRMYEPQQNYYLKGRPVSSIEEAKASMVDLDGSISYFPDIQNKRIFTKQIDGNGVATLRMYEEAELPQEPQPQNYVTKEELKDVIKEVLASVAPQTPPVQQSDVAKNF